MRESLSARSAAAPMVESRHAEQLRPPRRASPSRPRPASPRAPPPASRVTAGARPSRAFGTTREAIATAIGIFVVALVVRAAATATNDFPGSQDTAYYWGVARNAVEGRGLVSDAIWSFTLPPYTFPRPAFELWMPLSTLLSIPFLAILGTGFRSAQIGGALVSAAVPVLTWLLVTDLAEERGLPRARARILAVGAGLVACLYGPLVLYGALPDSTAPFTVVVVSASILMERVACDPRGARALDPRLIGIGVALGLAALTRNEAIWYALAWAIVAWLALPGGRGRAGAYLRLVGTPAVVAILAYVPWAVRQWAVFGTPLPGQAIANAFSRTTSDVYAWGDPPTLGKWLAQGPAKLAQDRVTGFGHNVMNVLILPAIPVGPIGLVGLPWVARSVVLRPLLIGGTLTFLATTLVFPVATTWGTFLHASGPIQVLLVASAAAAGDATIAWIGRRRAWRPSTAVLAPVAILAIAVPVLVLTIGAIGSLSAEMRDRYTALQVRIAAVGIDLGARGPVITDSPIWLAETARIPTLALPEESPAEVAELARRFGATYLVVSLNADHGEWLAILARGGDDASCFQPIHDATVRDAAGVEQLRVYRFTCR
jgi:hypothetical protein